MWELDEALGPDGAPRGPYRELIPALEGRDLGRLAEEVEAAVAANGVEFGPDRPIPVDPVPRLLTAAEWELLETGLAQRATALNAFIADAYGDQRIFESGVAPRRLLDSPGFEPRMRGLLGAGPAAAVCGFDVVRGPDRELMVLEDNVRMPSGLVYAAALRGLVRASVRVGLSPRPIRGHPEPFAAALRAAAPEGPGEDPTIALLCDGPENVAWFEHRRLAEELGISLVTPDRLQAARGRLFMRAGRGRRRVDVLYRRLDAERLSDADGAPTAIGELLLPALESGRLRCVNAFGTGVADDKLSHAYVEPMIRFYLGKEPLLRSVPTIDLGDEGERRTALEQLDDKVIKPRDGFGGRGVTIMPLATPRQRRRAVGLVRRRPGDFIAQRMVQLSTHPTVVRGRLRPRRVDLRTFAICGPGAVTVPTGALTRFARDADEMIVNSSQGGGCKDTWVVGP